jgi:hypothetical protein
MRDPGNLPYLVNRDLADARWPEPAQIRARGRRRTVRTVLAAPLVVTVLLASAWLVVRPSMERAAPAPGGSPSAPAPVGTDVETLRPSGWFGREVMLSPEDVGEGYRAQKDSEAEAGHGVLWWFTITECDAYNNLGPDSYLDYLWMRHRIIGHGGSKPGTGPLVQVASFPPNVADQVIEEARQAVEECAEFDYPAGEARLESSPVRVVEELSIAAERFAGDDSLLVRRTVRYVDAQTRETLPDPPAATSLYSAVRVGERIEAIILDGTANVTRLRDIASKGAARL